MTRTGARVDKRAALADRSVYDIPIATPPTPAALAARESDRAAARAVTVRRCGEASPVLDILGLRDAS